MSWTEEPSLTSPCQGLAAATCAAPPPASGSWIYAIGGLDENGNTVATVEAYDTSAKKWSPIPSLPTARAALAAASIPATPPSIPATLHVLGGQNAAYDYVTTHDVYEPATNAWSSAHPLSSGRGGLAAVTVDGLIYALGGSDGNFLTNLEVYDPKGDNWSTLAPMSTPRMALAAVAGPDGNTIYAIGGGQTAGMLGSVEVYDIAADSWTKITAPALPTATCCLAAAVGPNGLIYAIGGMTTTTAGPAGTANVYSYSPGAAEWAQQAPLVVDGQRLFLAGATGPDGLVYAMGGVYLPAGSTSGTVVDDVEAFTFSVNRPPIPRPPVPPGPPEPPGRAM